MKVRPILFQPEMVKAILDGKKTQTRRIIKHPKLSPDYWDSKGYKYLSVDSKDGNFHLFEHPRAIGSLPRLKCPYGRIGDRLWVRETWQKVVEPDGQFVEWLYLADGRDVADWVNTVTGEVGIKWKPSIHMPRKASRLSLEITNIRVERLQDISVEDAEAEGFDSTVVDEFDIAEMLTNNPPESLEYQFAKAFGVGEFTAKFHFLCKWNEINGEKSRLDNPFVWVIEFKKLEAENAE